MSKIDDGLVSVARARARAVSTELKIAEPNFIYYCKSKPARRAEFVSRKKRIIERKKKKAHERAIQTVTVRADRRH